MVRFDWLVGYLGSLSYGRMQKESPGREYNCFYTTGI